MGSSSSKNTETINWNNIKTENMSSAIPNFNGLSTDAKKLIASLNIPAITESPTSEFTISHILDKITNNLDSEDQKKFTQILDQVSSQTQDEELSATSPFISSEMYNYLVKNSEEQKGGASKKSKSKSKPKSKPESKSKSKSKSKRGGSKLDDDSETSSTSSDSEMEELLDSTEEDIMKEKSKKKHESNKHESNKHESNKHAKEQSNKHESNKHAKEQSNKHKDESDSELSGGELSYLSSSAHTEGDYSDSHINRNSSSESATTNSVESTSQTESSVKKHNGRSSVTDENNMHSTSISVNTEDINMVSDY